MKTGSQWNICTHIFIASSFTIAKRWKQPKCSLIDKWINQLWYVCVCVNAKQAEVEWFYDDLQDLLKLIPKKDVLFIIGDQNAKVGLECKSRKSRGTWSNRQVWPWSAKWGRAKSTEFCQENTLVIANTLFQQHKRQLYTWTTPDGQYWNLIIFFASEDEKALYSQQKQDSELTVAQIMNSLLQNSDLNWRK